MLAVLVSASRGLALGTLPTYGAAQLQFNSTLPAVFAASADFTCDGLADVVIANGNESSLSPITVAVANGQGAFVNGTSQVVTGTPPGNLMPGGLVLADFNGDGHADVFIPDRGTLSDGGPGAQNTLLLSTSDCHLVDATANIPQQLDYTRGASAADIDGDGDIDLVVVNDQGPAIAVPTQIWLNDGSAHFSIAPNALPASIIDLTANGYKSGAFVDVNGDGLVDLILGADERTSSSAVLLNDGTGRFTRLANAVPAKPFGITDIVMDIGSADIDHDGKPDLVFAERLHYLASGSWMQILINNGDGTFRDETSQRLPQADNNLVWFSAVSLVDIDGDGNSDIVGQLAYGIGEQLFAVADGNGVFTPVPLASGIETAFAFVDVKGDGHRDVLSAVNTVYLRPNTGAVLPPGVPQNVHARSMPDRVRLTWPYVWGATSYQIWRSSSAATAGSQIGTATATTFDDATANATTKYYTVRAVNSAGTSAGSLPFSGSTAAAPVVTTGAATNVGTSTATLNSTVNPSGHSATAYFQYGLTTSYDAQVAAATAPGSGGSPVTVSAPVTGLFCSSLYHFRAVASNVGGTATGADATFTTAVCPPPSAAALPYGIMEDFAWDDPAQVDYIVDKLVAAHVQTVRMPFRWYMIEPTQDQFNYGFHDPIVTKLRAKGIEILGLLQHPPDWASGINDGAYPPLKDSDWQDYVSRVATRYRGQVAAWEVWNEENLTVFFKPQPDAVRYTQILKVAFNAIRAADPAAIVVLGGLGGNGVNTGNETPVEQYFLQKIYDNGGKDYFDVAAIHPYTHPVTLGLNVLKGYIADTRAVMAANGDAAKPLWLTEIGWTIDPTFVPPIDETIQANWLSTVYNARRSLGTDRIYWYELHELYTPPIDVGWGLIRHDLTLRPSYFTYMGLTTAPPVVTTAPQSQLVASGGTATMSVAVTGAEPLTFQWYLGPSGTTSNPIGGANGSSYTTPPLTSQTSYWVRVSNAFGAVNSAAATMSVGIAPAIATPPQSQTILTGTSASLSVAATGTAPLAYQWYVGQSGITASPIANATSSTFNTPALTTTTNYWVRVSNGYGAPADSPTATITVVAAAMPSELSIDTPASGATVSKPLTISGWAINRGPTSGTGVDAVHLYAVPSGGSPVFLGVAAYGLARSDIGGLYGSRFTNSGYSFTGGGSLAPGVYTIIAYAHNASTGAFDGSASIGVTVTAPVSQGILNIDTPASGAVLTSAFEVRGWAIDRAAATGPGVDAIQFYVQPAGQPAPGVFVGAGSYGTARADVGAAWGSQFTNSGWHFTITGMAPGSFTLGAYARSTVTGSFSIVATVPFTINANQLMSIDVPGPEATTGASTFAVAGWSIDRSSSGATGTGVDALHVYAYRDPDSPTPPVAIFLGIATVGFDRPDVAAAYGAQYASSGYILNIDRAALGLTPGVYSIVVHSLSSNGTFNNQAVVRVTLQ